MLQDKLVGGIGTLLSALGAGLQTNEVLQAISIIITIIGGLITFIIMPLLNWYRNAKKDNKIDNDELKDGVNIIIEGSEKIKNEIDKKEGK